MRALPSAARTICLVMGLLAAATCAKENPISPGPDPVPTSPPAISCPADVSLEVQNSPTVVSYPSPVVTGGVSPVTATCTIPPGSPFPVGKTDIICTATDTQSQRAQCVFHVTVSEAHRLKGTNFLAFGDSITCCEIALPQFKPQIQDPEHSYAAVLEQLLRQRYTSQSITFTAAHRGGERAVDSEDELRDAVDAVHPNVLLLFEGANDINSFEPIENIVGSLRADIRRARQRGVQIVFISTVLPQIPGLRLAFNPDDVVPLNDELRQMAAAEGAILVDNYAAVAPRQSVLIGNDGLHPTEAGAHVIAETFLAAIIANYEESPKPTAVSAAQGRSVRR